MNEKPKWKVQVKGEKCSNTWEISVIREDSKFAQPDLIGCTTWGWFGKDKLLVSHNGGACKWPIVEFVWDEQIRIANDLCDGLNSGKISLKFI